MRFLLVGFVTFAVVNLYREQDLTFAIRQRIETCLARWGWEGNAGGVFAPRRRGWVARFVWKVVSCGFCLGVYVAFLVAWYATRRSLVSAEFWLTWWGAWGVHVVLWSAWTALQRATEMLNGLMRGTNDDG